MAEDREILIRDPNAVGDQQALVPLAGVKDFYARDADPGAVGTGSVWKDTDASPPTFWERNAANDGWDPIFDVFVSGGDDDAFARMRAYNAGAGGAQSGSVATTEGAGQADARPQATSGGALLGAGLTGAALAGPLASSDDGDAVASPIASTSGAGNASASPTATATDAGDAHVEAFATATTGEAHAGSTATRGAVTTGMYAYVDDNGVGKIGFNAVANLGGVIAIPVIPATPTEQDIADALVALGLATQAAP